MTQKHQGPSAGTNPESKFLLQTTTAVQPDENSKDTKDPVLSWRPDECIFDSDFVSPDELKRYKFLKSCSQKKDNRLHIWFV